MFNPSTNDRIVLSRTMYGKSAVRLVKVSRAGERHDMRDLNVAVALEGDFADAYMQGDNTQMVATDTMRNTVYALAKEHLTDSNEAFGLTLADHFLRAGPTVEQVQVTITEFPWTRIVVDGQDHAHSFTRDAGERTATITGDRSGTRQVAAGIDNLLIMKTTNSGWADFLHDQYTTLPDAHDRILATKLTATWTYNRIDLDFNAEWRSVRQHILTTFTDHYSPSVQNTLYRMGRAVLEACPDVEKIHFALPNKHHLLFDLGRFGLENQNEIFVATDEPYGLIEGTVERTAINNEQ